MNLSLPGTNFNTTTQFSSRGNFAPPLQPTEPPSGCTKDVQEQGESEDGEEAEGSEGRVKDVRSGSSTVQGPFPARKRSAEAQLLPLTIEQSMSELKRDLWGPPGS